MRRHLLLVLLLLLSSACSLGQKRLNGVYDPDSGQFFFTDPNIIVKSFVGNRGAFMIKGADPLDDTTNRVGFIDETGKVVIKPIYINCSNFYKNIALVKNAKRELGAIDRSGKMVIPFGRHDISFCANGLIVLNDHSHYPQSPTLTVVDKKDRIIVRPGRYNAFASPPQVPMNGVIQYANDYSPPGFFWYQIYAYVYSFQSFSGVKKETKWGIINRRGEEVISARFDWIGVFKNGFAPFSINKKYGVVDSTGKELIPATYDNLELSSNKLLLPFWIRNGACYQLPAG